MKNRFLTIIILLVAILPLYVIDIFASCIDNRDWALAPCYAPEPSFSMIKRDWSDYYSYKGEDWMETKKSDMLNAYQNGTLDKWLEDGPPDQNQNVYFYYYLNDQIPNSDGKYASEEFANQNSEMKLSDVSPETGTISAKSNSTIPSEESFVSYDVDLVPYLIGGVFVVCAIGAVAILWYSKRK